MGCWTYNKTSTLVSSTEVTLSRTYSTRPYWVKLNDPKFPTKERHQHHIVKSEKIGERKYIHQAEEVGRDEYGKVLYRIPERSWMVNVRRYWTEDVPCTIDIPEVSWREEQRLTKLGEFDKLCDKRPLYRNGCPCCTRAYAKRLSAKSQRASVNQQLHNAVRDYGWTADPDEWYDVDINTAGVAENWDFWD